MSECAQGSPLLGIPKFCISSAVDETYEAGHEIQKRYCLTTVPRLRRAYNFCELHHNIATALETVEDIPQNSYWDNRGASSPPACVNVQIQLTAASNDDLLCPTCFSCWCEFHSLLQLLSWWYAPLRSY